MADDEEAPGVEELRRLSVSSVEAELDLIRRWILEITAGRSVLTSRFTMALRRC